MQMNQGPLSDYAGCDRNQKDRNQKDRGFRSKKDRDLFRRDGPMQSYRGVVGCKHIDFTIDSYGRINHLIILDDARPNRSDIMKRSALRSIF